MSDSPRRASRSGLGLTEQRGTSREKKDSHHRIAVVSSLADKTVRSLPGAGTVRVLSVGMEVTGKVKRVSEYGAFVDIGVGRDGLLHISELSTSRVRKVDDVVKEGDEINVWIKELDRGKNRISLTMISPGTKTIRDLAVGELVTGSVQRLTSYGAFVDIGMERDAMLHVKEMGAGYVAKPEDVVKVGDEIEVAIIRVDARRGRVDLGLRGLRRTAGSSEPAEDIEFQPIADVEGTASQGLAITGVIDLYHSPTSSSGQMAIRTPIRVLREGDALALAFESSNLSVSKITPTMLLKDLAPYLNALEAMQHVINEIQGNPFSDVRIVSIRQGSIVADIAGATEAVTALREDVIPWRREHAQTLAKLAEQEAIYRIEQAKAHVLATRAQAARDREEARKLNGDATEQLLQAERLRLENEKLRTDIHQTRIQLALHVIEKFNPTLTEAQKVGFVIKLLEPLGVLTESSLLLIEGTATIDLAKPEQQD